MDVTDDDRHLPFRAVLRPPESDDALTGDDAALDEDRDLSGDEIEAAYLRAMEITEAAEAAVEDVLPPWPEPDAAAVGEATSDQHASPPKLDESASARPPDRELHPEVDPVPETAARPALTYRQVVEALLFVGGSALTTQRISEILGGGFTTEQVEALVEELNEQYAAEHRPYSIQWGDSGYQYQLRPEFEKIRNRVYGLGPKEVKLSQEALEVLAFVAYQQPVKTADLETTERKNIHALLRQLIRRELVELRRNEAAPDDPTYHTTPRFLELFGLTALDDLPFPADFAFK